MLTKVSQLPWEAARVPAGSAVSVGVGCIPGSRGSLGTDSALASALGCSVAVVPTDPKGPGTGAE